MNHKLSIVFEIITIIILAALLTVITFSSFVLVSTIIYPKLNRTSKNSKVETFVAEVQNIYRVTKTQENKQSVVYNNGVGASTSNNTCNNLNNLLLKDKSIVYTVTLDYYGNITNLAVSNGEYEFVYKGEDLKLDDITESSAKNAKIGNSEISLSLCE